VLIESEEPWIPWEMCRLGEGEGGGDAPGLFLCEKYSVTRWMPGIGERPALSLRKMALVVPADSGLPCAAKERALLASLASAQCDVRRVRARYHSVVEALSSGQHDVWHFSGHGVACHENPDRSVILLEQREEMRPEEICGCIKHLGRSVPLVFLNACQSAAGALALTDIGGWARQFLRAGAGAFIGTFWSVPDEAALAFAKELYSRLRKGSSVGEAVQQARLRIRARGDPSWLAYTAFAAPTARLQ
jgi:CHAT domain-containing protein